MKIKISTFDTEWAPLSNFAFSAFTYSGVEYPTAEHAYQAAKYIDSEWREKIRKAKTPGEAKHLGQRSEGKCQNWDEIKVQTMEAIVLKKLPQTDISRRFYSPLVMRT